MSISNHTALRELLQWKFEWISENLIEILLSWNSFIVLKYSLIEMEKQIACSRTLIVTNACLLKNMWKKLSKFLLKCLYTDININIQNRIVRNK